jgi:lipopolysaccharide/colanic/teichoic acid biosynthesis glycosyltransferase
MAVIGTVIFIIPAISIWLFIKIVYGYNPIFKQRRIGEFGKEIYI